ncbi:hypothetical protein E2C01_065637 [Portunus trituberculatus]|uniref:Uncharacterized protein n=1 Tax=Portunus trituberculatus TaxID=210409 RepID=A0A5B7HNS8_PORTR|nr:hypothetical protein [Portunus trituberculatus]
MPQASLGVSPAEGSAYVGIDTLQEQTRLRALRRGYTFNLVVVGECTLHSQHSHHWYTGGDRSYHTQVIGLLMKGLASQTGELACYVCLTYLHVVCWVGLYY